MTVNETAHDLPPLPDSEDDVDHPRNLELEATAINQNFTQQVGSGWCGVGLAWVDATRAFRCNKTHALHPGPMVNATAPKQQILKRPAAGQDASTRKAFNPHPFFNPEVDEGCEPASVAYRCVFVSAIDLCTGVDRNKRLYSRPSLPPTDRTIPS